MGAFVFHKHNLSCFVGDRYDAAGEVIPTLGGACTPMVEQEVQPHHPVLGGDLCGVLRCPIRHSDGLHPVGQAES